MCSFCKRCRGEETTSWDMADADAYVTLLAGSEQDHRLGSLEAQTSTRSLEVQSNVVLELKKIDPSRQPYVRTFLIKPSQLNLS